jgi:pSer/pThr/pTyr-binding forkhead associated (FHA) protein
MLGQAAAAGDGQGLAMRQREDRLDPQQPALIVTYGNTSRKHRPLDRDVVVVGRSTACDVGLVSPEVAPIHCVLVRLAGGWRLRDCTGRSASRVNGKPAQDEALADGDTIQVGTFSLKLHLPADAAAPLAAPVAAPVAAVAAVAADDPRWQRSRRRWGERALRLRRELRVETGRREQAEAELAPRLADLDQQADRLRALQRDGDRRQAQLLEGERALAADRAALEEERARARARVEEEASVEFGGGAAEGTPAPVPAELADLSFRLERRGAELDQFAAFLHRTRQQLREEEARLARERARLEQRAAEATPAPDATPAPAQAPSGLVESLRAEIAEREAAIVRLQQQMDRQAARMNVENSGSYEAELHRYRLELEQDRKALNDQLAQLHERQAEMEVAARETELQMSRERAIFAHERVEMNRLREEIRMERERQQRDGGARDRLAPVSKLKEELTGKRQTEAHGQSNPVSGPRWRKIQAAKHDSRA